MTMYEAARLAKKAEVREMWLTHYSPSMLHPEDYMKEVKKILPDAHAARDKWSKTLDFVDEEEER